MGHLRLLLRNDLVHDLTVKLLGLEVIFQSNSFTLTQSVRCIVRILVLLVSCRDSTSSSCNKGLLGQPHKRYKLSFVKFPIFVLICFFEIGSCLSIDFGFELWVLFLLKDVILVGLSYLIAQALCFLEVNH